MKKLFVSVAALATIAAAAPASAASYIFTYTFNTGEVVTGSFDGTPNPLLVQNISNVAVAINGVSLTGPLLAHGYTGYTGPTGSNCGQGSCFDGSAVASTDPLLNNFFFADYVATADFLGTNYFYIIPWNNGGANQVATQASYNNGTFINTYNGQYVPTNFSLIQTVVPEPATWAMMIAGFGLVSFGLRNRRKQTVGVTYA